MTSKKKTRQLTLAVVAAGLGFAALGANAQIIVRRAAPVIVIAQPAPVVMVQPQAVVVADGAYVANPLDVVLVQSPPAPADVIFVGGDTFVWVRDDYGHRVQRFWGHGDLRHEVFARHDMLDRMRRENGGRLPEAGAHRDAAGHWGPAGGDHRLAEAEHRPMGAEHPGAAMPGAHPAQAAPHPAEAHPVQAKAAPATEKKK